MGDNWIRRRYLEDQQHGTIKVTLKRDKSEWPPWKRIQLYEALRKLNGENHQRSVACEELAELTKEVLKVIRGKGVNMRVCEEIADVEIVIEQLKLMHDPEGVRVPLFREFKLKRLAQFNVKEAEK